METYPRPHRKDARIPEAKKYRDIAEQSEKEFYQFHPDCSQCPSVLDCENPYGEFCCIPSSKDLAE